MQNRPYAVVFTYSFDYSVAVYLFETWDEAWEFLEASYKEEMRIDIEENEWDSHGVIEKENGYAKIFTRFQDGIDVTEMAIGSVEN